MPDHEIASAHLRRIGCTTYGAATPGDCLLVVILGDRFLGPPAEMLDALAAVPDGAGPLEAGMALERWRRPE
jgi:hypothetical protein